MPGPVKQSGAGLFVTFRLYGSLTASREFPKQSLTFLAMDRLLGRRHLQQPQIARLVRNCLPHCSLADYDEFRNIESWILTNPVKAGLAQSMAAYPWSSAAPVNGTERRSGSGDLGLETRRRRRR